MVQPVPEEPRKIFSPDDPMSQIREYIMLKGSMEMMESRAKELREKLFEIIEENGEEGSDGNITFSLPKDINGVVRLEKQRRVSRKLDEETADLIIASHAGLGDEVYEMKRVINEEALMAAYYNGHITEAELDEMFPVTVTWALRTPRK